MTDSFFEDNPLFRDDPEGDRNVSCALEEFRKTASGIKSDPVRLKILSGLILKLGVGIPIFDTPPDQCNELRLKYIKESRQQALDAIEEEVK